MPKYDVKIRYYGSYHQEVTYQVEADNPEEAFKNHEQGLATTAEPFLDCEECDLVSNELIGGGD